MPEVKDETFLTKTELCTRWKIGERALEKRVKCGQAPQPFRGSGKAVLWSLASVIDHEIKNTKPPVMPKRKKARPM